MATVYILVPFSTYSSYMSKVVDFNPPHLHLAPPQQLTPVEFRGDLRHQKLNSMGYRVVQFA